MKASSMLQCIINEHSTNDEDIFVFLLLKFYAKLSHERPECYYLFIVSPVNQPQAAWKKSFPTLKLWWTIEIIIFISLRKVYETYYSIKVCAIQILRHLFVRQKNSLS